MNVSNKVVIVGAGPAGVCAAAAAAESGAGVVLIDSARRLGGSVTAAMHRSLCGLYADDPGDSRNTLNPSWQRSLVERMVARAPADVRPRRFGKAWVLEFPSAVWEASLAELCDRPSIDRRMGTSVWAARREGNRVTAIQLDTDGGWIDTPALIDCTGGGHLLQLIGEEVMQPIDAPADRMLAGYGVRLGNIRCNLELLRLQIPYVLAKAVQGGELPAIARFTVFYPGPGADEGVCKLAINADEMSADDIEPFADRVIDHLRCEVPDFSSAGIVEKSPQVLPRDGRRLKGKMSLTEEDVLTARKHGGTSVHAWWPVERWDTSAGPTYAYPPVGEAYDVPGEAMQSAVIDNLFAAGNCISATAGAAASSRASGICLATGAAAGRMAATKLNR